MADYLEAPQTNYLHPKENRKITDEEYDLIQQYYLKLYPRNLLLNQAKINLNEFDRFMKTLRKFNTTINMIVIWM